MATRPDDLALLAGLLDGSAHLDGLEVDTELRWRLLQRLVSQGAAGPGRDRRGAGAATRPTRANGAPPTCRAAIPEPAAKEAAWQAIISGTLPSATFRATRQRVRRTRTSPELLAPYAARFFDGGRRRVARLEQRHGPVLRQPTPTRWPRSASETVRLTDEYLAAGRPAGRAAPAADRGPGRRAAGRCAASSGTPAG